jgi:hypothetical protein
MFEFTSELAMRSKRFRTPFANNLSAGADVAFFFGRFNSSSLSLQEKKAIRNIVKTKIFFIMVALE